MIINVGAGLLMYHREMRPMVLALIQYIKSGESFDERRDCDCVTISAKIVDQVSSSPENKYIGGMFNRMPTKVIEIIGFLTSWCTMNDHKFI